MIRIESTKVSGWEAALRGMRNPMNSWDRSDTTFDGDEFIYGMGKKDYTLAKKLADAGQVHGKYLRFITVTADIVAPRYWWIEYDTYKVGTVSNSCSTMYKIHSKPFSLDDFSHEHLLGYDTRKAYVGDIYDSADLMSKTIMMLNYYREKYLETKDKKYWWQLIQLLPQSYNQRRTVLLNYAVLKNIFENRHDHKQDEWINFCAWIVRLPYSQLITGGSHE